MPYPFKPIGFAGFDSTEQTRDGAAEAWLALFGADAAPDLRSLLLRAAKRLTCLDGQILCRQGSPMPALFIVISGRVEICSKLGDQPTALIRFADAGDVLGELEAVTGNPAVASLIVRDKAEVIALPISALGNLLHDPRVEKAMMQRLYRRMVDDNRVYFSLVQGTLRMRLAIRLLQIIPAGRVEANLRQVELAELLGCTREAVNRLLVELVGEAVIETGRNRIRLLDRGKLMQIACLST